MAVGTVTPGDIAASFYYSWYEVNGFGTNYLVRVSVWGALPQSPQPITTRLLSALQPISPIRPLIGPQLITPDKELSDKPNLGCRLSSHGR